MEKVLLALDKGGSGVVYLPYDSQRAAQTASFINTREIFFSSRLRIVINIFQQIFVFLSTEADAAGAPVPKPRENRAKIPPAAGGFPAASHIPHPAFCFRIPASALGIPLRASRFPLRASRSLLPASCFPLFPLPHALFFPFAFLFPVLSSPFLLFPSRLFSVSQLLPFFPRVPRTAFTLPQKTIAMQFSLIPPENSPLGGAIRYEVRHNTAEDIDVQLLDATTGVTLAAKRFASVTSAGFDAAPALRRCLRYAPETGATGFLSAADRHLKVTARALLTNHQDIAETADIRTFLPGTRIPEGSEILTSMPLGRLIPEGACDELTLFSEEKCSLTVSAVSADSVTAENYASPNSGLQVFRLDTRDFPGAETILVDAGACGTVSYTVVPAREEAVRLAWRSREGSIEHYSFPIVESATHHTDKVRAEGADGVVVTAAKSDFRARLVSAYESRGVLEALAGIIDAPEVWIVKEEGYEPVDVTTDEATIHRHGTMSCLEIDIRSTRKNAITWN